MKIAITRGWGNSAEILGETAFKLTHTKRIGYKLKRLVKECANFTISNPAWTWTATQDGKIVIDYGSYTHFGLIYEMTEEERKALFPNPAKKKMMSRNDNKEEK